MIRATLAAAALLAAPPLAAQSTTQEDLDARYDRALAAGYKALMLCSAIANAELFGAKRSEASVKNYELTGIYPTLDPIVRTLSHNVERGGDGVIDSVSVEWAGDMPPRVALHKPDRGCSALPIGADVPQPDSEIFARNGLRSDRFAFQQKGTAQDELAMTAFEGSYGADARTTGVVILRNGRIVGESYGTDHGPLVPQRTWSVAKSIAATLVGAAVQRGDIPDLVMENAAGRVSATVPGWQANGDPRAVINIDHLLRMASGRYSDTAGNRTDPVYWGGATVDERAATWPLVNPPGTVFRYANNDTLMAVKAIEETFEEHPPWQVLQQIGMDHTIPETDWQGNFILSSQVWSTARDLAKLGQLYLDDGVLPDGTRILPEGWLEYVSAPSGPQPDGPFGYGAGWWLFNKSEGVPPDTIAAMGNRGQYVVVVPSRDVVIVRRGEDPAGGSGFDIAAFTRDVLAALGD